MTSPIHRKLRQARPTALDEVPGGDRQERDLRAAFDQPAQHSAADAHTPSGRGKPVAGRKLRRPAFALVAAGTAVAVAAAIAGARLGQPDPTAAQPDSTTSRPVPEVTNTPRAVVARAALYAAAEIAGREADLAGKPHTFWHRTGLWVQHPPGSSEVRVRSNDEQWISVNGDDPGLVITRWADGSRHVDAVKPGDSTVDLGMTIPVADLMKLPTEPEALKQALLARYRPGQEETAGPNAWLFTHAAMVVSQLPVRTGTRAAGFRMLADLPGVRVTPTAKDPIGRVGTAVAISEKQGKTGTVEYRLVFDPRTSAALSQELRVLEPGPDTRRWKPGSVLRGFVTKSVEWTTQKPPRLPVKTPPPATTTPEG